MVSAYYWDGNEDRILTSCSTGDLRSVTSPNIIEEFKGVLVRKFNEPAFLITRFVDELLDISDVVYPKGDIMVVPHDPSDDKVLETALLGDADIIVSGDKHLLSLGSFRGIRILRAAELVRIISDH